MNGAVSIGAAMWAAELCQNSCTWPEQLCLTLAQDEDLVHMCQQGRPMRHYHDGRAPSLHCRDGPIQGLFPARIEIGVGFIQNEKCWAPVKRPSKTYTLPLT